MKAVYIFVTIEVLLFIFTTAVYIHDLTIAGPEGKEYRGVWHYHTLVTLMLIYMAIDHRNLAKGYILAFGIMLVIDVLRALNVTLYLTRVNMTAWTLDMITAWLNVVSVTTIFIWYGYIVWKNGNKVKYIHF